MSSHSLERAAVAVLEVDIVDWGRHVAAAVEIDSVASMLRLPGNACRAHEAGWTVAALRFADVGIPLFELCCNMVAVAFELEKLLVDCAVDFGRRLFAAVVLQVLGSH